MGFMRIEKALQKAKARGHREVPDGSRRVLIYALWDPRDNRVRYVGKTERTMAARLRLHMEKPSSTPMRMWLRALTTVGQAPRVSLLQVSNAANWSRDEWWWVDWFSRQGVLLNVEPGGIVDRDEAGNVDPHMRRIMTKRRDKAIRAASAVYFPGKKGPARPKDLAEKAAFVRKCGPVKVLSREEIAAVYGTQAVEGTPIPPSVRWRRWRRRNP